MSESPKRAIFFDRDGVLNVDTGYVFRRDQFEWMPGAKEAIRWLNDQNVIVIIVTNQSGIARGLFGKDDVEALMNSMQAELARENARIDKWYVCPHHPTEGTGEFTIECDCRKPKPGLILHGLAEFELDPKNCVLIGDKPRDVEAGEAASVQSFLFNGDDLLVFVRKVCAESFGMEAASSR